MRTWKWCVPAALAVGVVAMSAVAATKPAARSGAIVKRGEYVVTTSGCNDCHTPWKMGEKGPEPDMSRMLSGHPQDLTMPAPPKLEQPWMGAASATFTAWYGPWGTSFAANLTPDQETGLGKWTEQNFVEAMRTGRHMGRGRPILPPMPWQNAAKMTDADLKAVFAYLRSIPAIANRVPEPTPPAEAAAAAEPASSGGTPASSTGAPGSSPSAPAAGQGGK
ncbi:MAG TPA: c-type cytochrome [Anaeromyxobacteraceae bacterium]|nr:c-type cytochrome [Anaeromyxobacteraceae bacterium]